jgi:hypothetical protein
MLLQDINRVRSRGPLKRILRYYRQNIAGHTRWLWWLTLLLICAMVIAIVALFLPRTNVSAAAAVDGSVGPRGNSIGLNVTQIKFNSTLCVFGGIQIINCIDVDSDGTCTSVGDVIVSNQTLCNEVSGTAGPNGAVGPQGETGTNGSTGPVGPQGETGVSGPVGPQGETGVPGPVGPQGETGVPGPVGPQGVPGTNGTNGSPGPVGQDGMGFNFNTTNVNNGDILVFNNQTGFLSADIPWILSYSITPTTTSYFLTGEDRVVTAGLTATHVPPIPWWRVSHFFLTVNTMTGSGFVTVQGIRVRNDGGYEVGFSEMIFVDTAGGQRYQSLATFARVTQVVIGAGISAINYDIGHIRYWDMGNVPFQMVGIRLEARGQNSNTDIRFRMQKVQTSGATNQKFSVVVLEDFLIDSGAGTGVITDNVRTGGADRSFTLTSSLFGTNEPFTSKYLDYRTYWGDTAIIRGGQNEGIMMDFLQLNQNRELSLYVFYKPLVFPS